MKRIPLKRRILFRRILLREILLKRRIPLKRRILLKRIERFLKRSAFSKGDPPEKETPPSSVVLNT